MQNEPIEVTLMVTAVSRQPTIQNPIGGRKSMKQIPVKQAANELEKLLDDVAKGQEIVIISLDGSAVKLIALPRTPHPKFGSARGLVSIGPDFDKPIEGLEKYHSGGTSG